MCAAGPASDVGILVRQAQAEDWTVCVVATPSATAFIDAPALANLTGYPVRVEYRTPGTEVPIPPASAIVVAPATFNTINKWAAGVSDTLGLGLINEAIGLGLPLVAMPFVNDALAAHPAFNRSIEQLRKAGVEVIFGPGEPHPAGSGGPFAKEFAWHLALSALRRRRD